MPADAIFDEKPHILEGTCAAGVGAVTGTLLDVDDAFENGAAWVQTQTRKCLQVVSPLDALTAFPPNFGKVPK